MSTHLIAFFTLREALRRRVVLAAALLTLGYLVLYGVGVWFGYRDLQETQGGPPGLTEGVVGLMLVGGLWSLNFIASVLAVFISVGALSGEIDQGTLHAIAARPVRRSEIVLGKFLGFTLMLAVFIGVSASLMILIVAVITGEVVGASWSGPLLMLLAAMILIGLALAGSSRLSPLPNGVIVFTLYSTALIGGVIEQIGDVLESAVMFNIGIFSSVLIPTRAIWDMASAQLATGGFAGELSAGPFGASNPPSGWMLLVAALHLALTVGFALRAFERRDF